jgi:hypothetical protein
MKQFFFRSVVFVGLLGLIIPSVAFGQGTNVALEVPFGQTKAVLGLADYLLQLYTFIVTTIGVVAAVMIMFHGIQWAAAAGNSDIIGKAKDGILHAIIGVVLAFSSYLILYTINPALVQFTNPSLPVPMDSGTVQESSCGKGTVYLKRPSGEQVAIKSCDEANTEKITLFGMTTRVNKEVAASLKAIDAEWQAKGGQTFYAVTPALNDRSPATEHEGYNCRKVTGGTTYSIHAYGLAIDVNPKNNPYQAPLRTDMPADFVAIWEKHGWGWGGRYSKPDPMHFSKYEKGGDRKTDK